VVLQLLDAVGEALRLPDWLATAVVIALILGFPVVFILAWLFDVTGEGVHRTRAANLLSPGQSFTLFAVMLLGTGGLGFGFYQYYSGLFNPGSATAPTTAATLADTRSFQAPINSIAVLPFADLSEEQDQAYLSDGMAEEILNLLAQVDGLQVAARTSSFAFRNPQQDIRDIGRRLNVSTVLEGSLRTSGNNVRLTAQLINVEDGYHIWSDTFDRELTDVFSVQDEVASAIAAALVENFAGLQEAPPTARPQNIEAFRAYTEGRKHWWERSPEALQTAISYFAEALEHDSEFAPAYAAIADSWILLALYGNVNLMRAVERAQPMIEKALSLDPESAEAYAALGLARHEIGQNESAEKALREAIRLNDSYVPARLWLASLLEQSGRLDEQYEVLRDAMAQDPLNELLAINFAGNLSSRGDYAGAEDVIDAQLMMKPDSPTLLRTDAQLALNNGMLVEGWKQARRAYDLQPGTPVSVSSLARAWFIIGDMERAEALLAEGLQENGDNLDLMGQYFQTVLVLERTEEARGLLSDMYGSNVEALPPGYQRQYHFLLALTRLIDHDFEAALSEFEQSLKPESKGAFDGDQIFALTAAAFLHQEFGDPQRAEAHLAEAEAAIRRARERGRDSANIHYNEALIRIMRNKDVDGAISSLQEAYSRGWRELWIFEIDGRLAPLGNATVGDRLIFIVSHRYTELGKPLDPDAGPLLPDLRAGDPMAGDPPNRALLSDGQWVSLQNICAF